ncbi:c-type cytochrome, methanol metabolism-related [Hyphomicrobium sp.]|jgi:methanol metabolism-related c-type cytochrome|uniref:c-type cytochrome, methanol metabolism-related n=1 Tax=Hyphomicrobium sp. TaxID=82 RepID=UPI002C3928F1|nr:c-type cytochrome, methanol metabolism-related [Hyphomicrobium sp.]HVZ03759.1 c-type cytochrome, methanol metabolism-related [Hyphomicrobium sp.]
MNSFNLGWGSACRALLIGASLLGAADVASAATPPASSKAVKEEGGKYFDAKGDPTYKIAPDGTVDWYTFSGFRRFNGTCDVCHGPDGAGSSFGPDLTQALKSLDYSQFAAIVSGGKQDVNTAQTLVMPAFGTNKNVMCYLDDIYVYLRARSDGALGRGRPAKHQAKSKEATDYENSCMGP